MTHPTAITVGTGKPGPITRAIQKVFFGLFDGSQEDQWDWLDKVPEPASSP